SQRVRDLAMTPDGEAVAWVEGTHRYATLVDIDEDGLISACTCPYGITCKHAVAVLLALLEHLRQKRELPAAGDTDPRLVLLEDGDEASEEAVWDEDDGKDISRSGRVPQSLHEFL